MSVEERSPAGGGSVRRTDTTSMGALMSATGQLTSLVTFIPSKRVRREQQRAHIAADRATLNGLPKCHFSGGICARLNTIPYGSRI
jgi:hypothetical protein